MFQKNKDIFNILSDAISEGIVIVDEGQNIVSTNSAANAMFGYDTGELKGQNLNNLIPSKYHSNHGVYFESFYNKSEKRKMGHGRDLYGITKDNKQIPVEVGLNPFTIYKKTYIMALVIDISERKEIQKKLNLRSEALQSAGNGIVICDALKPDIPIIYFNTAFQKLTGYSSEEILNKNCRFLQGSDRDQEGIKEMSEAIKRGNDCQLVLRNYKKDGSLFWNDLYINPIRDSNGFVTHYIGIQNDITDRKYAEQERNYLARIFDGSLNEIYVFDKDSLRFLNVNYGAQTNIGYTLEELSDLTPLDIQPDFTKQAYKLLLQSLNDNSTSKLEFESTHQRKDGTVYPVFVTLELSAIGERKVYVAIILDITETKNYTQKLENTVELRTKQLKKALNKEIELNELKTKFLSLVSHEFKTPLSGILTSSMLLKKYELTEHQSKRDKHIKIISEKVHYLNNILNDFLTIEKLETGQLNYKFSTFKLSKVVNEVVYNSNMLLKEGQKIHYPENIEDIHLTQDEKILELALSNLVHNAIKYSPENSNIDIEIHQDASSISFIIKDDGIGIPEKDQKNIFNRYFRAENAILLQGTGIGLNIVKTHLEKLGGTIHFKSAENVGSTFIITIPNKAK